MKQMMKLFAKKPRPESRNDTSIAQWPDEDFIRAAFEVILGRTPKAEEIGYYATRLSGQIIDRKTMVRFLFESPEWAALFKKGFPDRLHEARMEFVRRLPRADVIVDLGGSCPTNIDGALYTMGYPHRAKRLIIVDLPFDTRMVVPVEFAEQPVIERDFGRIEYVHSSMTDLSAIESGTADLVFSGESIEHITEAEGDRMIAEALRVLKSGGEFWLDTPNGRLTRIHMPNEFIHPEHKIEYLPEQVVEKLRKGGFEVREVGGIMPLARAVETGEFDPDEAFTVPTLLHEDPSICYCFYIRAVKPAQ